MSRSYQRPENALKRANEFIDVGKPSRALEVLYEVIKRGKMRTNYSEKLLEPIMFKYLELCVDLKKSHLAKEGLYQYRNIFQSVNVSSLETVVKFYLELADDRTESARKESHQAVVDIDDLDNLATPEEILLSAVSGEDAQDRSDRTILTPWVKFLWESYRQCLELLRTNSRVEKLYHNIAQHAFKFCEKYNRKTEFRKLCDNLRTHLAHIQKQQGSATAVNLNNPETQQLNLETRLEQLNFAIKMELWQEAYKAIEDISDLMKKSKKMPKPHVMASYYEKLALVFWKAGNHLFHAAALFKLFQLLRDQKKNITPEEVSKRASIVLVATLAIPLPSAHPEFDRFIETEKSALEKIERLANLLSLSKPPTRESLIKDLVRLNVVSSVPVDLQNMYQLMEVEFDPLHLCNRMQVHLNWIKEKSDSGLPQYIAALQEMTITRLVKQVAQVYQTITFIRLLELAVFMTPFHLERILVDLVRHNDLQIRIDHRTSCVHFGVDLSESQREDLPEGPTLQTLPSETIRCQLVHMSSALQKCLALISPDNKKKEMEPVRAQTIQMYHQTRQRDHQRILQRQHIIEERKEMLENQNLEREEQLRKAQEEQLKRQKEEEQERLRREASKREKERHEEQLKQIHTKQIKDKLMQISKTSYGQKMIEKIDKEELLNLGAEEILQRQVEELEKERKELQKKLKTQEKSVDYFERARRLLEIPRLKKALEVQREKDKEFWETQEQERVSKLIEEHRVALEHSQRLERMLLDRDTFVEKLKSARSSEIQKKLNDFNARLEVERKVRLVERKEQRRRERREVFLRQKEEEEQKRRDEELKKQREDEERLELERSKKEEEERTSRRKGDFIEREETSRPYIERNGEIEEDKTGPWRPKKASAWRQKEQEKLDVWRVKDDEREREPLSERLASRDIRRDEPPREKPQRREEDSWRDDGPPKDEIRQEERNDWRGRGADRNMGNRENENDISSAKDLEGGADRNIEKGPSSERDGDIERDPLRDRDMDRGPPSRDRERDGENIFSRNKDKDFEKDPPRDFERGPLRDKDRDFERGPPRDRDKGFERDPPRDKDRDFERGPPLDKDRDFERGPPRDKDIERGPTRDRDRDIERGPPRDFERGPPPRDRDRDFERGPPRDKDRDFERGPPRDRGNFERGPPRDRDRDFERGPPRDRDRDFERGPPRDRDRDFERGPPRDRDRDFERGPPRDFERGPPRDKDRDFERGPPRDRDFERGPPRDRDRDFERGPPRNRDFDRGPPRDRDRDFDRGPRDFRGGRDRDFERGPPRDFDKGPRDGGRFRERDDDRRGPSRADEESSWRRSEPLPDSKKDGFRRGGGGGGDDRRDTRKGYNAWRGGGLPERDEPRFERRDEPRSEKRDEPRPEKRDEPRPEKRDEPRSEKRDEPRSEKRDEPRSEKRDEPRSEKRDEPRSEKRDESRSEKRDESRSEKRDEPRSEKRDEPRSEKRDEPRSEKRDEPRSEKRDEPRSEKRDETRYEKRDEPRSEKRDEPRSERREDNWGKGRRNEDSKDPKTPREEPRKEPKRPKEEIDEDGWTKVRR